MKTCKPKPCSECLEMFTPRNSLTKVCGYRCALERVNRLNERKTTTAIKKERKAERKAHTVRKQALKSKSDWLREAQTACNAYIRERDKDLPCINCGNTRDVKYAAGHYLTRGAHPEIRFHPFNINRQCDWYCNLQNSGNISKYRPELIKKIGLSNVEWLEGGHQAQNLTIDDIKEIKAYYREQLKLLKH